LKPALAEEKIADPKAIIFAYPFIPLNLVKASSGAFISN
jgi:hypothetical protein